MASKDADTTEDAAHNVDDIDDSNLCGMATGGDPTSNGGMQVAGATASFTPFDRMTSSSCGGVGVGMSPLLANVALADSFHGTTSSGDEPSTESRMCTEESIERMTSSTEGMVSLSEDSSGRDTYAQAHGVCPWNSASGASGAVGLSSGFPQHADTIELDESDEQMNGLLGSYREISIEEGNDEAKVRDRSALLGEDTEEEVSNLSPDSGPVSPLDDEDGDLDDYEVDEREERNELSKRPNSLHLTTSSGAHTKLSAATRTERKGHRNPTNASDVSSSVASGSDSDVLGGLQGLQGLVLRDGEMVSFVAEDLQEQIKRASPVIRRGDTPSFPGSRSSTPSLYKQALTPQLAPIDPTVLNDVEAQARCISSSIDTILENLTGTLHSMSSLTVDCMESYHDAVCKTCDSIDGNIKSMYQLMAKFEELGNLMRPVYRLSGQIKEIKRLLDLLDQVVSSSGT